MTMGSLQTARMRVIFAVMGWIALAPTPAASQVRDAPSQADASPIAVDTTAARTPDVNAGRIGQRQTREDAASKTGIKPMARINNRIANRVQSRLRNRIGPNYDPRANAASPFEVAEEQVRARKQ